ncbi:histidine kinase [Marivirga lumbricoides]
MKNDLLKRESYIILMYWIIMFFVFFVQVIAQTNSVTEAGLFSLLLVVSIYPIATYLSRDLLLRAMRLKKISRFVLQFFLFSLLNGIILLTYLFLFHLLEQEGFFPKSEYFSIALEPFTIASIFFSSGVFINLCICGLRFLLEYIRSQKVILEYQLRTLQHQVTPHFMFNVLNHIHILMQEDVEKSSSLLLKYSEILRYQLYEGSKKIVRLEQDIQFIKDFISIEEFRWSGKLTTRCSWEVENGKMEIPALLFIVFIENAFKYATKSESEPGFITIHFKQQGNMLKLEVENSKHEAPLQSSDSAGLGLKNIRERLEILYHSKYSLDIVETENRYHINLQITA